MLFRVNWWVFLIKKFKKLSYWRLSLFIHNISSKHDRETTDRTAFRNTSQLKLKCCLYMFHWTAILFRIQYLPFKNFAVRCSFSITCALNTAETVYEWSLFVHLFVYGFIFSLKKWACLNCERVLLYSNDRLVGFSSRVCLHYFYYYFF